MSHVERTIRLWRGRKACGSDITWNPVTRTFRNGPVVRSYDLFGFGDYQYLEYHKTVMVQIGGPGEHKAHKEKILAEPRALQWLRCDNYIELITWSKRRLHKDKPKVWWPRIETITEDMFGETYGEEKGNGRSST
jgi:hypothetical protein